MSTTTYGWLVLAFPLAGMLVTALGFRFFTESPPTPPAGSQRRDLPRVPRRARGADLAAGPRAGAPRARLLPVELRRHRGHRRQDVDPRRPAVGVHDPRRQRHLDADPPVLDLLHGRDSGFVRYFSYLNFFVFSMLLLVLAGNFLLLIVGWAFVGAASYLLISFWYRRTTATKAGIKAFVINVVGDAGLVLGTFFIFKHTHTLDFLKSFHAVEAPPTPPSGTPATTATSSPDACCCWSARSPSRRRSRCTRGSRTRWRARPPSAR